MPSINEFFAFLMLFAAQVLALSRFEEELDSLLHDPTGRPSSSQPGGQAKLCKKDLLLIVDCSYSIGEHSFIHDVKPFLQRLVTDPSLNVGLGGTQVAMIIFSETEKTKLLFNFESKTDPNDLANYMGNLNWNDVKGGSTRTDLALTKAYEEIFKEKSPGNYRPDVDDVIVLITDGKPSGAGYKTEEKAINWANKLKDEKNILIVAAAIGPEKLKFIEKLEDMASSPDYTLQADFKEMDALIGKLVASLCTKPGQCLCHSVKSSPNYVQPGETKALVSWPKPTFTCMSGRKAEEEGYTVVPNVRSPSRFPIGKHTIAYIFHLKGGVDVECPVSFEVKGEMCRGIAFNSRSQVCCCGTIHDRKNGYECCGPDYYNTYNQRCCPNANLVSREENCPVQSNVNVYVMK